jgi:hypothetical protein
MADQKKSKSRDKSTLEATAASLKALAAVNALEITDRIVIAHNLDMIMQLRSKRIPHAAIYNALVKSGGLRITQKTYISYLSEVKRERGLTRKPAPKLPSKTDDNPA